MAFLKYPNSLPFRIVVWYPCHQNLRRYEEIRPDLEDLFYLININRNELLFISGKFETTKNQHLGNVWIHAVTWVCEINAANNCKDQRRHLSCLSTITFHETPCIDSRKHKNVTRFLFKYDGGLSRQTTSFLSSPQSQFVEVEFAQEPDKNLR